MKLVIRSKPSPKPTGENDPATVQKVVVALQSGRPWTARGLAKHLHLDEMAVSRIIYREFKLNEPGPRDSKQLKMEWVNVADKSDWRVQETLFTFRAIDAAAV